MAIKKSIKKAFFLTLTLAIGGTLLMLFIAAINKKNNKNCNGVEVEIKEGNNLFLNGEDVMNIVVPDKNNALKGKPLASFDLKKIELTLKENAWIENAELFFDNNGVLKVSIEEREPIARVFTNTGYSFYIDSSGRRLPLSSKMVVKLPVYSNFPISNIPPTASDSILMNHIKEISRFLIKDSFWMSQLAQIDITASNTFEMVPLVGNHIIVFGDGSNFKEKFHKLFLYYQQVAINVGFDKYAILDAQYKNEVVGIKKETGNTIDSLQILKNIEKMINRSSDKQVDTLSVVKETNIIIKPANIAKPQIKPDSKKEVLKNTLPNTTKNKKPVLIKSSKPLSTKKDSKQLDKNIKKEKPKAVVKKVSVK